MTSEIVGWGQNWRSDRFGKELKNVNPSSVFFEDDDPRIELIEDSRGEPCWVIGYTPRIDMPGKFGPDYYVGGYKIVLNVKDYAVYYLPEKSFKGSDQK